MESPKAKSAASDQESALLTTNNSILPDCPAASKLPTFRAEPLATPIREPQHNGQIRLAFDVRTPLPDDWAAQVLSAINHVKNRALIADSMTPGAKAFWEGCRDE